MPKDEMFYDSSERVSELVPPYETPRIKERYKIADHEIPPRLVESLREEATRYERQEAFFQSKVDKLNRDISIVEKMGQQSCYVGYKLPQVFLSKEKASGDSNWSIAFNDRTVKADIIELARVHVAAQKMNRDVSRDVEIYQSYDRLETKFESLSSAKNLLLYGLQVELRRPYVLITVPKRDGIGYETHELAATEFNLKRVEGLLQNTGEPPK